MNKTKSRDRATSDIKPIISNKDQETFNRGKTVKKTIQKQDKTVTLKPDNNKQKHTPISKNNPNITIKQKSDSSASKEQPKNEIQKTNRTIANKTKINQAKALNSQTNSPSTTTVASPSHQLLTTHPYRQSAQVLFNDIKDHLPDNLIYPIKKQFNDQLKPPKFTHHFNKKQKQNFQQNYYHNESNLPSWAVTRIESKTNLPKKMGHYKSNSKDEFDAFVDIHHRVDDKPKSRDLVPVVPKVNVYPLVEKRIMELLNSLKIIPNDITLYEQALTHNTYANETADKKSYQRLEFLGDSIINKLVTVFLFSMSDDDEGRMTKDRISIIQAKTLIRASNDLNLKDYLLVGQGLKNRPISGHILEDIFEAFVGAIFLDQGEVVANRILMKTIIKYYLNDDLQNTIDYKTKFQEAMQEHCKQTSIQYKKICCEIGKFEVELVCNGIIYGHGQAPKLHEAEVLAAKEACEKISKVRK